MGARQSTSRQSATPHELWKTGVDLLIQSGTTSSIPASPDGLSRTINEHIRELSMAFKNLWEGSIYSKSLDYLLRVLLRLHLAPQREKKTRERVQQAAAKKKEDKKSHSTAMSRCHWKQLVKGTCDKVSDLLQHSCDDESLQAHLRLLSELQQLEPKPVEPLPNIEEPESVDEESFHVDQVLLNMISGLEDHDIDDHLEGMKSTGYSRSDFVKEQ
jgi:hypothetical protein